MNILNSIIDTAKEHFAFTGVVTSLGTVFGATISGEWAVIKFRAERRDRRAERRDHQRELMEAREERDHDRKMAEQRHLDIQLRESQKPFLEQQLKLYLEITKIVAQLAIVDDVKNHPEIQQRFWELYWGELSIVETKEIEDQMTKIADAFALLHSFEHWFSEGTLKVKNIDDAMHYKWLRESLDRIGVPILPENQNSAGDHLSRNYIRSRIRDRMQRLAYYLAHHVRRSIESGWAIQLKSEKPVVEENVEGVSASSSFENKVDEYYEQIKDAIDSGKKLPQTKD